MAECAKPELYIFFRLSDSCSEPGELVGVVVFDTQNPVFNLDDTAGDWYIGSDWDDATKWASLISSNAITVMGGKKRIEGSKPKSSPVNAEFAGKSIQTTRDHTGEFRHHGVDKNTLFWSAMNRANNFSCGFVFRDGQMAIPVLHTRDNAGVITSSKLQAVNFDADWDSEGGRQGLRLFGVSVDWENKDLMVFKKIPMSLFQ
mgnify:CR=1 FL=1